jgi:hypothetical protein
LWNQKQLLYLQHLLDLLVR